MPDVYNSSYTGTQIDAAVGAVINKESSWDGKQDKLTGAQGQVVGFDDDGDAVAMPAPDTGVTTFNGRTGTVMPQAGDYDAADVGAIPASEKGAASGVASLGSDGKVPGEQLPDMDYIPTSQKGAASGVAELDSTGRVPSSQLPSYVDDVLEYDTLSSFPPTGEDGKIYIAKDTNRQYRWSGSQYVEISPSLALGETSSTAYRGDRGKTAYDHSQTTGNPHNTTAEGVGALPIGGGTLTGPLTLSGDPTGANQAATKAYVDGKAALVFTNISVTTSMTWGTHSVTQVNDQGFTQRVAVPISGVTVNDIPLYINLDLVSRYNGNWSDYCDTYDGGLYLYAKAEMAATIESATFVSP